jgi:hypothetical protein
MKKLKPFAKGTQSGNYYNYFRDAQDHLSETPVFPPQSLQLRPLLEPVSRYFKFLPLFRSPTGLLPLRIRLLSSAFIFSDALERFSV